MNPIQIKGPSLKYIPEFIEEFYKGTYNEWFRNLPENSKRIFENPIMSTGWYDLNDGHIEAIKTLGKVYFNGDFFKAAYEMGKFGGKKALTGIYSVFIKIPSLEFIVKRVSSIAATYYTNHIEIMVTEMNEKRLNISVKGFYVGQELMMPNISGWLDNLMSIISKKSYSIEYSSVEVSNNIEGSITINFGEL
jgi:hypothetical protein